jgi:hypothetical protein
MQKRLVGTPEPKSVTEENWMDLEAMTQVELTSEDPGCPIEGALLPDRKPGWRASEPGSQSIRLLFHQPQRLRRILLRFEDSSVERTQEFALRWSPDGGRSSSHLVRQQYSFSPAGSTSEVEDFMVDLGSVTALELTIIPDQGRNQAYASLAEWRLA